MMKKSKNAIFSHKVKVKRPVDGGYREESFTAQFQALQISESNDFNLLTDAGTDAYLKRIFVGWGEDYVGEDDQPIPYNDAERDELIDDPVVRIAILNTYNAALLGARQGN